MGLDGDLCHFDNAPQDEVSVGAAEVANSRHHPAPNARPHHPPPMCLSVATQQWKKKTIQAGQHEHRPQMAASNTTAMNPEV